MKALGLFLALDVLPGKFLECYPAKSEYSKSANSYHLTNTIRILLSGGISCFTAVAFFRDFMISALCHWAADSSVFSHLHRSTGIYAVLGHLSNPMDFKKTTLHFAYIVFMFLYLTDICKGNDTILCIFIFPGLGIELKLKSLLNKIMNDLCI